MSRHGGPADVVTLWGTGLDGGVLGPISGSVGGAVAVEAVLGVFVGVATSAGVVSGRCWSGGNVVVSFALSGRLPRPRYTMMGMSPLGLPMIGISFLGSSVVGMTRLGSVVGCTSLGRSAIGFTAFLSLGANFTSGSSTFVVSSLRPCFLPAFPFLRSFDFGLDLRPFVSTPSLSIFVSVVLVDDG